MLYHVQRLGRAAPPIYLKAMSWKVCIASEMQRGRALDMHSSSRHLLSILKELAHSNTNYCVRVSTGGLNNIYIWRVGSLKSVFDMAGFGCKPFILTLHMTTFLMRPCVDKKELLFFPFWRRALIPSSMGVGGAYLRSLL